VGLVWFAVSTPDGTTATERRFPPTSREAVRLRATATALDLLRRSVLDRL
jgi:nicotinamide mononucleotide (NMN) deamidase PncC